MTTIGDLVAQARAELQGGMRDEINRLNGAISANATSLTFEFAAGGIAPGAYLAIDDEIFYVFSASGQTATVIGAQQGTTAASHADDSLIEVNPSAPRGLVKQAMVQEIRSWPSSLFRVATVSLSPTSTTNWTSLLTMAQTSAQVRRVLEVRMGRDGAGSADSGFETSPQVRHFEVVRGLTSATSVDIQVKQQVTGDLWVAYATEFDLSVLTDVTDLDDVGVEEGWLDFLKWGIAMRLVPRRELLRNQAYAQGEPRNAAEVQSGANSQVALMYKALRDQRITEEATRLRGRWPERGL